MHDQLHDTATTTKVDLSQLQNFTIREEENGFVVALKDDEGYETVRGFGPNPTEALNDLHRNLI